MSKTEWVLGFKESGISDGALIEYGFKKLRASGEAFIPPVGRFIEWCREGLLPMGTKSGDESYKEILDYRASPAQLRELSSLSPETYHTMQSLSDYYGWTMANEKTSRITWMTAHKKTLEAMKDGQQLKTAPVPVKKIEQTREPVNLEKFAAQLKALKA